MIRVLLADDNRLFSEAMALALEQVDGFTTAKHADSIEEARPYFRSIDIALVGISAHDGWPIRMLRELRLVSPRVASVAVTPGADPVDAATAVEAGVSCVVPMTAPLEHLTSCLRRAHAGEALMAPAEMIEMLRRAARQRETRFDIELRLSKLTRRELEVLRLLAEGLGDSEIADRLSISTETVRVHMPKMLGKLGVNSRLQALVFAWKAGVSRPYAN